MVALLSLLVPPVAMALSEVHVDFQPASGATAAGYIAVTNTNRWDNGTSVDLGGGVRGAWLDYASVHTGDRSASSSDTLYRDFIQWNGSDTPETFKTTGILPGTYNLKIYAWDTQYSDKQTNFDIDANNDGTFDLSIQISNPAGEHSKITPVTVSAAGVLSIKVSKIGAASGAICGLDLTSGAADTTPPAAISLASTTIGSNQVMLTWTASGDDGTVGTASTYNLRYSINPITDDASFNAAAAVAGVPSPKVAGSAEAFTVTGLAASTTYCFALKVADEVPNVSGLSNIVEAATLPPHTWDPTDIGSELWAWGWAGTNSENLTLVDGPNGKLINRMTDLSGRGHDFVGNAAARRIARLLGMNAAPSRQGHATGPDEDAGHGSANIYLLGYYLHAEALIRRIKQCRPDLLPQIMVIDFNLINHNRIRSYGLRVMYGDISNLETLRHAGIQHAKVVVSTIANTFLRGTTNERLIDSIRSIAPAARIVSTCVQEGEVAEQVARGAFNSICEPAQAAQAYLDAIDRAVSSGDYHPSTPPAAHASAVAPRDAVASG